MNDVGIRACGVKRPAHVEVPPHSGMKDRRFACVVSSRITVDGVLGFGGYGESNESFQVEYSLWEWLKKFAISDLVVQARICHHANLGVDDRIEPERGSAAMPRRQRLRDDRCACRWVVLPTPPTAAQWLSGWRTI